MAATGVCDVSGRKAMAGAPSQVALCASLGPDLWAYYVEMPSTGFSKYQNSNSGLPALQLYLLIPSYSWIDVRNLL